MLGSKLNHVSKRGPRLGLCNSVWAARLHTELPPSADCHVRQTKWGWPLEAPITTTIQQMLLSTLMSQMLLSTLMSVASNQHDDIIKRKHIPPYWPFVRGIHWSLVNSPHKGKWRGALMFSLICVWINAWVNNREAGELRCHRAHYNIIVMYLMTLSDWMMSCQPGSQVIVTVSEQRWKHRWATYKSFGETGTINVL